MKIGLVFISDLHYKIDLDEDHGLVQRKFLEDLESNLQSIDCDDFYLLFTGDIVHAGTKNELYESFAETYDSKLERLGLPKKRRVIIPGNHDLDRKYVIDRWADHEGLIKQLTNERSFNDYISKPSEYLVQKFDNYVVVPDKPHHPHPD